MNDNKCIVYYIDYPLSCLLTTRFTASWPQGPIRAWDGTAKDWEREKPLYSDNSDVIVLKRINNSNNSTSDFLKEVLNINL